MAVLPAVTWLGLLCSAALTAGPWPHSPTDVFFVGFLPSLQVSSTFHEDEQIRGEAVAREEEQALLVGSVAMRGLLSHTEGFCGSHKDLILKCTSLQMLWGNQPPASKNCQVSLGPCQGL